MFTFSLPAAVRPYTMSMPIHRLQDGRRTTPYHSKYHLTRARALQTKPRTSHYRCLPVHGTYAHRRTDGLSPKQKIPGECKIDTVNCQLIDNNGVSKGQGISYYQYNFPINIYQMHQGDSIHVAIRHDMKREILPGVSDIGIKISKIQ